MKEFKTAKSRETYHRVLESSIRLFQEKGFDKATMRGISKEAKLGLGALYYYFPSKESIVLAFYNQIQAELVKEWPTVDPGEEVELKERLQAFLNFKFEKLEPHRPLLRVLLKEAVDPDSELSPFSEGSKPALDQSQQTFLSMVQSQDNPEKIAKMLWLGHLALIALWIHRPDKAEKAVEAFSDMAPFMAYSLVSGGGGELFEELLS